MAPNMAKPTTKPMAEVESRTSGCAAARSGMIGSAARRSTEPEGGQQGRPTATDMRNDRAPSVHW